MADGTARLATMLAGTHNMATALRQAQQEMAAKRAVEAAKVTPSPPEKSEAEKLVEMIATEYQRAKPQSVEDHLNILRRIFGGPS